MADVPVFTTGASYTVVSPAASWRQRVELLAALLVLCLVDLGLRTLGFARVWPVVVRLRRYRERHGRGSVQAPPAERARELRDAIDRACIYYVRPVDCLTRALSTLCVLASEGLWAELVIGVQHRPFSAHAWVELDGTLLNDHALRRDAYSVIHRC